MAVPLDEYPIHQVPLSFAQVGTTDRNFYDRCIFQCFPRDDDVLLITGLGVYPNLGVIDAFAAVRTGDRQVVVRASDALGDDRMTQAVGPYQIDVVDPLRRLRLVADTEAVSFDLTWDAVVPAIDEPHHIHRPGGKTLLDAQRFVQHGSWSGVLRVEGTERAVDDWVGTRDRSWGIRPVGEAVPPGRPSDEASGGFWHTWAPIRFDDFGLFVFSEEDADGHRIISQAVRVWPEASGRPYEELGWPEIDLRYRSGTRIPTGAVIHLAQRGKPIDCEIELSTFIPLAIGAGYGGDPEWHHGMWKGRDWLDTRVYDLSAPDLAGQIGFSVNDFVARATFDGAEGWGIFEHASFGRHDPSGFTDFSSVSA